MKMAYICSYVHYRKLWKALQEHAGSFINRDGAFGEAMWKVSAGDYACGGTQKIGRTTPLWCWSQGQRPWSPPGIPPRTPRRPAPKDAKEGGAHHGSPRRAHPQWGSGAGKARTACREGWTRCSGHGRWAASVAAVRSRHSRAPQVAEFWPLARWPWASQAGSQRRRRPTGQRATRGAPASGGAASPLARRARRATSAPCLPRALHRSGRAAGPSPGSATEGVGQGR